MRFKKAILGMAIGSAAVTAWAIGPESGADMFGMGGEGRGGHHFHGHGHGHGHGQGYGRGGPGGGRFGEQSPEQAQARAERMAERLVRSVDGTPEQKEKISAIAKAAATDLVELRKQAGDLRRQGMDLLKAPTIDRGKQMGMADALSKRMATALAETAEVLSPEQRAKLAERMQSHRPRRG